MTKAERKENEFIISLGCMVCGSLEVEIHHNRRNGGKRKNAAKIPLCTFHHSAQSNNGLHHGLATFELHHGSVNAMADYVTERLKENGMTPTWEKTK